MTFYWLVILVICGLARGWDTIGLLEWLLLIPFAIQDSFDTDLKKWLKRKAVWR